MTTTARPTGTALLPRVAPVPILAAIGLFLSVMLVDGLFSAFAIRMMGPDTFAVTPWKILYFAHTGMLLASLGWIAFLSRGELRRFGFRAPVTGKYIPIALIFGVGFGLVMTAADYWHNLAAKVPPPHFQLAWTNIVGLLSFEALYAGTIEEVLFRGLLLTFLMQRMSGRIRVARFDIHVAGVIVAAIFCLAHLGSFWTESLAAAVAQQLYAFVWAVTYAYWFEKSGSSLLPSIIGHNVGNFVEDAVVFWLAWHWS